MGQLTFNTRLPSTDGSPVHDHDHHGYDLQWLCLLDQLYELIETDGIDAVMGKPGSQAWPKDWPEHWESLMRAWATRIGAKSVKPGGPPGVAPSLRHETRLSGLRSVNARPPAHRAHWPAVSAQSGSPDGFTANQEREFHALCSHLYSALALNESLDAARESVASLYSVIDVMPMGIALLDEQLNVVLINRQGRETLTRTEGLALRGRRLCLPSQQAAFDRALHEFVADPFKPHHHLQLNGLDVKLKKLAYARALPPSETTDFAVRELPSSLQFSVLLLIHERCDQGRPSEIATPPALLARHVQRQYALTDKELPLAWNLAQGMPLKQYAGLSGRSIETSRAQLKSVFRKLGATDQKSIGLILFETLHAVILQSMGEHLATAVADHATASPEPIHPLPWR